MKITKTINDDTTTYFYDGIKKYEHYKDSNGFECWSEYKDGNVIHYKDSDGYERWSEYKDNKVLYFKNSNGFEWRSNDKDDEEIYFKNINGKEWWNYDYPNHPKNEEIAEEDVKPFEFEKE